MKQSLGFEACHENTGSIGNGSCVGEAACFRNGCEEEDDGTFTCSLNEANVGDDSCIGYHACRRNTGTINIIENMDSGGSCSGESACEDNQGDIGVSADREWPSRSRSGSGVRAAASNSGAFTLSPR